MGWTMTTSGSVRGPQGAPAEGVDRVAEAGSAAEAMLDRGVATSVMTACATL